MKAITQELSHGLIVTLILSFAFLFEGKVNLADGGVARGPKERWVFTSQGHFSWYALLALAPIYRDRIEGVLFDDDRVYVAVGLSGGGAQFLGLGRERGDVIWQKSLAFEGWPERGGFAKVGNRLIAVLYQGRTREFVILALSPVDGNVIWQARLGAVQQPAIYETFLEAGPTSQTVTVYQLRSKQQNRMTLMITDGQQLSSLSYNGYLWPYGTRRAAGLVFGYDGVPHERKYHRLLAFNEDTGQLAWTLPLLRRWTSPPVVVDDSLLITSEDKFLRVDLKTGKSRWTVDLGGYRPLNPDPPVVLGSRIAVAHTATLDPEDKQWKLSLRRLVDGKEEAQVALHYGESETFSVLRRMGDLVIVGSYFVLQVIDSRSAKILATLDFEKLFSRFVYADPPAMRIADSDGKGFVVITSDGKLWYFAAEDFRGTSTSQVSPTEKEISGFNFGMIFFYLVVNPLWDMLLPNRVTFLVLFYGFPLLLAGLVWAWKPVWVLLRRKGIARGARWGGWIGLLLSLPAAIYRGLLGGIAAGFGSYGSFGPIWGGLVGFSTFMAAGLLLGISIGCLCSLLARDNRTSRQPAGND